MLMTESKVMTSVFVESEFCSEKIDCYVLKITKKTGSVSFELIKKLVNENERVFETTDSIYISFKTHDKIKTEKELYKLTYEFIDTLHRENHKIHEIYPAAAFFVAKQTLNKSSRAEHIVDVVYCEYITNNFILNDEYDTPTRVLLATFTSKLLLERNAISSRFQIDDNTRKDFRSYCEAVGKSLLPALRALFKITDRDLYECDDYFYTYSLLYDFRDGDETKPCYRTHLRSHVEAELLDYNVRGLATRILVTSAALQASLDCSLKLLKELSQDEKARQLANALWLLAPCPAVEVLLTNKYEIKNFKS